MTTFRKLVTSIMLAGITFAPAIASAQTVSVNTDNTATVVTETPKELGRTRGEKHAELKGENRSTTAKLHSQDEKRAELKGENRSIVAKVQQAIKAYRKSAQQADAQYKKSVGEARNTLMHAVKEAVKAGDKDAAYRAFEAYFKSEDEAEAKRDATRVEARGKLTTELKAILG